MKLKTYKITIIYNNKYKIKKDRQLSIRANNFFMQNKIITYNCSIKYNYNKYRKTNNNNFVTIKVSIKLNDNNLKNKQMTYKNRYNKIKIKKLNYKKNYKYRLKKYNNLLIELMNIKIQSII